MKVRNYQLPSTTTCICTCILQQKKRNFSRWATVEMLRRYMQPHGGTRVHDFLVHLVRAEMGSDRQNWEDEVHSGGSTKISLSRSTPWLQYDRQVGRVPVPSMLMKRWMKTSLPAWPSLCELLRSLIIISVRKSLCPHQVACVPCFVLPALLYGADTWPIKLSHIRLLNTFHHPCILTILGISSREQWQVRLPSTFLLYIYIF